MNLKKLLFLVVLVYITISAYKLGAPVIRNAMLENDLDEIARELSVDGTVPKAISQVNEAVSRNEIPAFPGNYTVIRDERIRKVLVEVRYTVEVALPFGLYTHTWNFSPSARKNVILIPRPGG